jgi:hypothetical protein
MEVMNADVPSALTMDGCGSGDTAGVCISGSSMGNGSSMLWQGPGVAESCFDCCTSIQYTISSEKIEIKSSTCGGIGGSESTTIKAQEIDEVSAVQV